MANPIDWAGIVEKYSTALVGVVAKLFAMAWLYEDGSPFIGDDVRAMTLPRRFYRTVLGHLRAAESALRRIIVIAARDIVVEIKPAREAASYSSPPRGEGGQPVEPQAKQAGRLRGSTNFCQASAAPHLPAGIFSPQVAGRRAQIASGVRTTPSIPPFALIDPRQDFAWWWRGDWYRRACEIGMAIENGTLDQVAPLPRPAIAFAPPANPDELIASGHLSLRLLALKKALDDIPGQARRLARLQARVRITPDGRKLRSIPMRHGYPPGHRKKRLHAVDDILHNVDYFAHRLLKERHDTS